MSNTSEVTPYAAAQSNQGTGVDNALSNGVGAAVAVAGACMIGTVVAGVALATWLAEDTAAERAAAQIHDERRRRERQAVPVPAPTRVSLNLRTQDTMLRTAERLGYQVTRSEGGVSLLQARSGERLALVPSTSGRVDVLTAGSRDGVRRLVREHTAERAVAHLRDRGMQIKCQTLPDGKVQIVANETRDGKAQMQVEVRADGTTWVDVSCVEGRRCEQLVGGLAEAIGGRVDTAKKKDSWYREPGEPTQAKVKV